jgi:sulfur carrier protein ThiS
VDGQESLSLEGQAGKSVWELLETLTIPSELVAAVLVNGRLVQKDHRVQNGDEVKLIPLLGGG